MKLNLLSEMFLFQIFFALGGEKESKCNEKTLLWGLRTET